jgi:hypothetical protein
MRRRKEDYIILTIAIVLVGIIFGIVFVLLFGTNPPAKQPGQGVGAAPTLLQPAATPAPVLTRLDDTNIFYNQTDGDVIKNLADDRRELSTTDIQAKDKMLQDLFAKEPSGYVYQSERVGIKYLNPDDVFIAEITTTNMDGAKKEAVDWLLSKGFSHDGICKIPLEFTLSSDVIQKLSGSHIIFSPRAPGCK